MILAFLLTADVVISSEYEKPGKKENERHDRYESRIYGTVNRLDKKAELCYLILAENLG